MNSILSRTEIKGTILLANEGINGTISGKKNEISEALERDNFMTADVAQSFGLIDEVVEKRS